jgi:hypothetical protein
MNNHAISTLKNLLGQDLISFSSKNASFSLSNHFSVYGNIFLYSYRYEGRDPVEVIYTHVALDAYLLDPTIEESCSIRITEYAVGKIHEVGKYKKIEPVALIHEFGTIIRIVCLGEVKADFQTLQVIGFLTKNANWQYLFFSGENDFRIELVSDMEPAQLCKRWDFVAMEKETQVLADWV